SFDESRKTGRRRPHLSDGSCMGPEVERAAYAPPPQSQYVSGACHRHQSALETSNSAHSPAGNAPHSRPTPSSSSAHVGYLLWSSLGLGHSRRCDTVSALRLLSRPPRAASCTRASQKIPSPTTT